MLHLRSNQRIHLMQITSSPHHPHRYSTHNQCNQAYSSNNKKFTFGFPIPFLEEIVMQHTLRPSRTREFPQLAKLLYQSKLGAFVIIINGYDLFQSKLFLFLLFWIRQQQMHKISPSIIINEVVFTLNFRGLSTSLCKNSFTIASMLISLMLWMFLWIRVYKPYYLFVLYLVQPELLFFFI